MLIICKYRATLTQFSRSPPFLVTLLLQLNSITMGKSNHFSGQPLYSQVIKLLNKAKILHFSNERGGERYTSVSIAGYISL